MITFNRGKKPIGYLVMAGGILGLLLAPVMVTIKYMTGWSIIPQPSWVDNAIQALGPLLKFGTPPQLWSFYGCIYTTALVLMFFGLLLLSSEMRDEKGRLMSKGYWIVLVGFLMVIPGDAIHSLTWHQNGLTIPTPGTNPVANTAYAVHMLGMNLVMLGSLVVGVTALRRRIFVPGFAWFFVLLFPSAVLASVTLLPTTPSGALWFYCLMMITFGFMLATGRSVRRSPSNVAIQA